MWQWLKWTSIITLSLSSPAWAAVCCGGGFAAPSIISGDQEAQLTMSLSDVKVTVDSVDAGGIWRKSEQGLSVQTFKIESARLLADLWQAGFSLPVQNRARSQRSTVGIGDVSGTVAYEFLPDWDYNPLRPKGLVFFQMVFPTGNSVSAPNAYGTDLRGRGFFTPGIGTLLTKNWDAIDAFLSTEIHRSVDKSVDTAEFRGRLRPSPGGSAVVGAGYNFQSWRIGGSAAWNYEGPVRAEGTVSSRGILERYATATASVSYLRDEEWAATLTYSDQTLLGSPLNTSLGRGVALAWQRRWSR